MKKFFCILTIFIVFLLASCAIFDDVSDIDIYVNAPDEIVVYNNASVSTLTSMDGKIIRNNKAVYHFHFDVDIPATYNETIKFDDFILQEGDRAIATDAKFTAYDM